MKEIGQHDPVTGVWRHKKPGRAPWAGKEYYLDRWWPDDNYGDSGWSTYRRVKARRIDRVRRDMKRVERRAKRNGR